MPTIASIQIFPVKALDPVSVKEVKVLAAGGLENDRRWAFVDRSGKFVNGKSHTAIHRLRSEYDLEAREILIEGRVFSLDRQREELARFVSDIIQVPVELRENRDGGFPDDTDAPGPTLVAEESLKEVGSWFDLAPEEVRRRFRVNIEVAGTPAFWEDRLYGTSIHLGDVRINIVNPCARCPVPTRDPLTGIATEGFQQRFIGLRKDRFPEWGKRDLFTHYYRLTANTRIPQTEAGKMLCAGDWAG
jgi:uncharacterized protein YcbX